MTIFNKKFRGGGKIRWNSPHPKPLRGRQTILRGRLGHIKKFRGGKFDEIFTSLLVSQGKANYPQGEAICLPPLASIVQGPLRGRQTIIRGRLGKMKISGRGEATFDEIFTSSWASQGQVNYPQGEAICLPLFGCYCTGGASQGKGNYSQGQAQPNKKIQEWEMHRAAMNKESMY